MSYKERLLNYLPLHERESKVFSSILYSHSKEFDNLDEGIILVSRNLFLDTAIENLKNEERDLGISTDTKLDNSQRREQISSRNRASFDQTTAETMATVAGAYGNGEVEINETDEVGVFSIKFTGIGIPNNLDGLKKAIDIIIPAHLGVVYIFTFRLWRDIKDKAWSNYTALTWNELRELEGVN